MTQLEELALYVGLDEICNRNDINPLLVVEWLDSQDLIDLSLYFNQEETYNDPNEV